MWGVSLFLLHLNNLIAASKSVVLMVSDEEGGGFGVFEKAGGEVAQVLS